MNRFVMSADYYVPTFCWTLKGMSIIAVVKARTQQ